MFPNSPYAHPAGSFTVPMPLPGADPQDEPQVSVSFNCAWLPYIRGALTQLLLQSTWDTDEAGLGEVQSQVWRLISLFGDKDCNVCDCIEFVAGRPTKFVSDGHGGGTFVPIDPRTDGDVPPPWPTPPSGQTGNCLAAANIAGTFKDMMVDTGAKLVAFAAFGTILVSLENFLDLALPLIGEVIQIATEMAAGAIDAGATAFVETFDPSAMDAVYHELQCIMSCHLGTDGTVTADIIQAIKDDFDNYLPGPLTSLEAALWRLMFFDFLDSQGKNGLMLLGNKNNISSADCSDCSCGWCYTYNAADGAFIWAGEDFPGEYSHTVQTGGLGWVTTRDSNVGCPCSPVGVINAAGTVATHVNDIYVTISAPDYIGLEPVDIYAGFGIDITPGVYASTALIVTWEGSDVIIHLHPNIDATDWQFIYNFNKYSTDLSKRVVIKKIVVEGTGAVPHGAVNC